MTTDVVREEIRVGSALYPELVSVLDLEWLSIEATSSLDRISRFVLWTKRVGAGSRNLGEASVLALTEELGAIAILDDRDATRVGRTYGVEIHGTIWLLAQSCRSDKLTLVNACNLIDSLRATGMRLPCTGAQFPEFARKHGLLEVPRPGRE